MITLYQRIGFLLAIITLMIPLIPSYSFAAAWVKEEKEFFMIIKGNRYKSTHYWDKEGNLHPGKLYLQKEINPLMEYGLTPRFTIGLNPFFRSIDWGNVHESMDLDNFEVYRGRYLFWSKNWSAFSGQLTVNYPLNTHQNLGFYNNAPFESAQAVPAALTQRQHYVDARLLFGTGGDFGHKTQKYGTWYADFQFSVRKYYNGAGDEVHADLTQGWKSPGDRIEFLLKELTTLTMHNPKNQSQPYYNLITIEPSFVYWLNPNRFALQLGADQDVYGTRVGKGTTLFFGVWVIL